MKISEIKEKLKIGYINPVLEEIFASPDFDAKDVSFLSEEYMREKSRKYSVLGEREDDGIKKALKIKDDEAALTFFNLAKAYLDKVDGDIEKSLGLCMPDGYGENDSLDMLPMAVLFTQLDKAKERYIALGMSENDAMMHMEAFGKSFEKASTLMQRTGLNRMYFNWLCIYLGAGLITVSGFNFEMKKYNLSGVFLKNKNTGKLLAVIKDAKIHSSGLILGTAGCENEEGSYFADLTETDTEYIGYPVNEKGLCEKEKQVFKKMEWEKVLSPGDYAVSFHIPKGADLSRSNLDKVFSEGIEKIKSYYSDKSVRCVICGSWLLSPQFEGMLKEGSNIVAFGKRFTRLPFRNGGNDVFSFVFPPGIEKYEDLPENTSLERALKKLYMEGNFLYSFYGAFEIR